MRHLWTPTERCELVTRYPAEGAAGVARRLGRSMDSVTSQARRYGIQSETRRLRQARSKATRSATVNARFFEEPTPTVAFVLGFIWACGSLKTRHRRVLRLSCEPFRQDTLREVLRSLGSRHQIQHHGRRLVVEISNSRLVDDLMERCGDKYAKTLALNKLPPLAQQHLPEFAWGHLMGTGFSGQETIRWTGRLRLMTVLQRDIQVATHVCNPIVHHDRAILHIAWTDNRNVQALHDWLKTSQFRSF